MEGEHEVQEAPANVVRERRQAGSLIRFGITEADRGIKVVQPVDDVRWRREFKPDVLWRRTTPTA